jgi:hypothetical protein
MALDIVIGRHGDSLQGRVLNKAFNITTQFGSLAVPTRQIRRIYFRAPGAPPHDEIYLKNSDKLVGAIRDQFVQLHGVGGTDVAIPVAAVLAVLIEWMEQPGVPALLEAAKPLRATQKARRR